MQAPDHASGGGGPWRHGLVSHRFRAARARPTRRALPQRPALTILELLVTMAIVGILAAVVFPALSSAREAARRTQCVDHLKQIGLALHIYHNQHACLPPGWRYEATAQSAYGWAVPLLPFLEHQSLYRQIDRDRPLTDPVNSAARRHCVELFLCPSDVTEPTFLLFAETDGGATVSSLAPPPVELPAANYVGVFGTFEADDQRRHQFLQQDPSLMGDGTFIGARPVCFAEMRRGLSNTLVVGERTMQRVPSTWLGVETLGEDAACRLVGSAWTSPSCRECDECEFASRHPGGANFLWADGHVCLVSHTIPAAQYRALARRSGL